MNTKMTTVMARGLQGMVLAGLAVLATGCQPNVTLTPVSGVLTINDQPVPHASIQFIPTEHGHKAEYFADGVTDDEGRYTLRTSSAEGAVVGPNRVVITEGPMPEEFRGMSQEAQEGSSRFLAGLKNRPLPGDVASAAQSNVIVEVTPDKADYPLEFRRN